MTDPSLTFRRWREGCEVCKRRTSALDWAVATANGDGIKYGPLPYSTDPAQSWPLLRIRVRKSLKGEINELPTSNG